MTSTIKNYSQQMVGCQKKLMDIKKKLQDIKKRTSKIKTPRSGKGGGDQTSPSQNNVDLLKKEIEVLERDIVFVSSWVEAGNDLCTHSFTSRFMKRMLPGRTMRDVSSELRLNIIYQSLRFFELKLSSLETWTRKFKKKKSEDAFASKDLELHKNKSLGSLSSERCRLSSTEDSAILPNLLMEHSTLTNAITDSEHKWKYDAVSTDYSVINLDFIKKKKTKRKPKKSHRLENETLFFDKSVQTENSDLYGGIQSEEKFIQTDGVDQVNVLSEIYEALNKIMEERSSIERSPGGSDILFEDSLSNATSDLSMDRTRPANPTTEILIPPLWMVCLQDNMDLVVNSVLVKPEGYDGIHKQSEMLKINELPTINWKEIISLPINIVGLVGKKKLKGQRWLQSRNYCLTEVWGVKETFSVVRTCDPMEDSSSDETTPDHRPGVINEGISVKVIRKVNTTNRMSKSLQIDYCDSNRNIGRIFLTESGSEDCATQSEILCRIVTCLLGLTSSTDKT